MTKKTPKKMTGYATWTDSQKVSFYKNCGIHAKSRGYSREICEDFPGWAFERKAMGSKATIHQLFIDYLRTTFGTKETGTKELRDALTKASANAEVLEMVIDDSTELDASIEDFVSELSGKDKEIVLLYFQYGWTKKEIGSRLGVTEARVSQKLKQILITLRKVA